VAAEASVVSDIAGRYAAALFELAVDENALDEVAADLATVRAATEASEDLRRLVTNPVFSAEEQGRAMAAVLDRLGIGRTVRNFVGLVAQNRRLFALSGMTVAFNRLLSQHRGEVVAEVTVAEPLSETQLAAVRAELAAAMKTEVSVEARTDPGILGGLIVRVGSRMVDSSLRTKLQNLKFAMKGVE
jgi:F-type H+-transporting ATPase subunit delta